MYPIAYVIPCAINVYITHIRYNHSEREAGRLLTERPRAGVACPEVVVKREVPSCPLLKEKSSTWISPEKGTDDNTGFVLSISLFGEVKFEVDDRAVATGTVWTVNFSCSFAGLLLKLDPLAVFLLEFWKRSVPTLCPATDKGKIFRSNTWMRCSCSSS